MHMQPNQENYAKLSSFVITGHQGHLENFTFGKVPWTKLLLVCTHMSRDKRCGRAGPQVLDAFRDHLRQKKVAANAVCVAGSSHIGGHAFAGTLIVYPKGDCYGYITKRNASELLDHVLADETFTKYLRGSLSW